MGLYRWEVRTMSDEIVSRDGRSMDHRLNRRRHGPGTGASRRGVADETSRRSATMTLLDGHPPLVNDPSHGMRCSNPPSRTRWAHPVNAHGMMRTWVVRVCPWVGRAPSNGEERGSQPRRRSYCSIGRTTWCGGMNVTDQAAPDAAAHGQAQAQAQVATCPKCPSQLASHAEFVSCRLDSRIGPGTKGVRMSGGGGGGGRPISSQILQILRILLQNFRAASAW